MQLHRPATGKPQALDSVNLHNARTIHTFGLEVQAVIDWVLQAVLLTCLVLLLLLLLVQERAQLAHQEWTRGHQKLK
jgi:hypothetical protein